MASEQAGPRQKFLLICLQYDAMFRDLPDPIWWISGNPTLSKLFADGFLAHLRQLERITSEGGPLKGISATRTIGPVDRNDMSYVPATTVKDGVTLKLSGVEWQVTGSDVVVDSLAPVSYQAVVTIKAILRIVEVSALDVSSQLV